MRKLILSNFHPDTTEEDLLELFEEYGIESAVLTPGKYAVLTFKDQRGAAEAKEVWGRAVLYGYWFRIKYADW